MRAYPGASLLGFLACLLTACGGGSSSSSSGQRYPVNDAVSAYMQSSHSYTLHSSSGGDNYTTQIDMQPGPMHSFMGTSAFTMDVATTVSEDGAPGQSNKITEYFQLGPYKNLGSIDHTSGYATIARGQTALPDLAQTGQAGAMDTETTYLGAPTATGAVFLTRYVNTWTLSDVGGDTAQFCEIGLVQGEAAMPFSTFSCLNIDARGNVLSADLGVPMFAAPGGFN